MENQLFLLSIDPGCSGTRYLSPVQVYSFPIKHSSNLITQVSRYLAGAQRRSNDVSTSMQRNAVALTS